MALLGGILSATSLEAEPEGPIVDLELILAVDVSSSMSEAEQRIQRDGYVSAFRHPDVVQAIRLGPHGVIAVSYVEWAGPSYQRVVLPWTSIGGQNDADRFAAALAAEPILREAGTSISSSLLWAHDMFAHSRSQSERRVVDVSGDGPNNAGPPVAPVRDMLIAAGISINGLPLSLHRGDAGALESFEARYLEAYFERCVIGGPDAFVIGIRDLSEFKVAVRRKLVREIAGLSERVWLAAYRPPSGPVVDCSTFGHSPGR